MMNLKIYQVDAFAEKVFSGNPAAVIPLNKWLADETMQKIALENNLSETAFFIPLEEGFHIRWFTPKAEVELCGHATLATAHVLFKHMDYTDNEISFKSMSGMLRVKRENGLMVLNFPTSAIQEIKIPENLKEAFNISPSTCYKGKDDLLMVYSNENEIKNLVPDFRKILNSGTRGIIVTARSEAYDFVSRFFAPAVGINEDPVTGSAHTMLIPYWSHKLNKTVFTAKQISARGGVLYCKYKGERVEIGGKAITFMIGEIFI